LWTWLWLMICDNKESFYAAVNRFLTYRKVSIDDALADLVHYQKEIMLSPQYDPTSGKNVTCRYNWQAYFLEDTDLIAVDESLHYGDTHMGASHQYPLVSNDLQAFVTAAIGYSYPYSKFRHFFHQPDRLRNSKIQAPNFK